MARGARMVPEREEALRRRVEEYCGGNERFPSRNAEVEEKE